MPVVLDQGLNLAASIDLSMAQRSLTSDIEALAQFLEEEDTKQPNWWHSRAQVLGLWLGDERLRAELPDDGMDDLLLRHIHRGTLFPSTRIKCWKHIVLELQDIPCLMMRDSERICTSPIRGKLRAGKELVLAESNQDGCHDGNQSKAYGKLSMMDRQAEWLRRRDEKVEAERTRLETAKYKDVTFRPKLIRRSNSEHIHRKVPGHESNVHVQVAPRPNSSSVENFKAGTGKGRHSGGTRPALPRSASFKKKPHTSQKMRVKSALLDSLKAELSISQRSCFTIQKEQVEDPAVQIVPVIESPATPPTPEVVTWPEELWRKNTCIGGLPVEFDSSDTRARIVLQDASHFDVSSMYRKTDRKARRDGIALLMGRREDNFEEQVIAVVFDKEKLTQKEAADWWMEHVHRFKEFL